MASEMIKFDGLSNREIYLLIKYLLKNGYTIQSLSIDLKCSKERLSQTNEFDCYIKGKQVKRLVYLFGELAVVDKFKEITAIKKEVKNYDDIDNVIIPNRHRSGVNAKHSSGGNANNRFMG